MTKTDIPLSDAVRQTLKRLNGKMLIAGEWIGAGSGDLQAIINPATGIVGKLAFHGRSFASQVFQ